MIPEEGKTLLLANQCKGQSPQDQVNLQYSID